MTFINLKKIFCTSIISALVSSISVSPCYALDYKFFEVFSTNINNNNSFSENFSRLNIVIQNINEKINQQEKLYLNTNYKKAKKELEEAKKLLEQAEIACTTGDPKIYGSILHEAVTKLKFAQLNLMPSRNVEMRGMYIDGDSIPKTKAEISELIKKLKKANFNVIFPEVFRRGYTIVRSSFTDPDPTFKDLNFDILDYLIQEAHKNKIEVHPWFWCFRVKSPEKGDPILSKYPNLVSKRENDPKFEPLFMSPAEPQARELVSNIITFFAKNYEIDGILMDYIRYDDLAPEDTISKKYFKKYYVNKYGKEPPLEIPKNEPVFVEWQLWRENQVNLTVELIKKRISSLKPNLPIGAAVFRTEGEGRLSKMQDWRLWDSNGWIKYVSPMLYTNSKFSLNDWLNSETDLKTRNDFLYPIFGAHKFNNYEDFYIQYGVLYNRFVPGSTVFTLVHFNQLLFDELSEGIFRKKAIIPHNNPIKGIKEILGDISIWLKEVAKNEISLPEDEMKNYIYKIDILKKSLPEVSSGYKDHFNLKEKLEELKKLSQTNKDDNIFPDILNKEIKSQLDYAIEILKIYIREQVSKNKVFKQSLPPLLPLNETKELPTASVVPIGVPPVIDGIIDSNIWSKIEPLRNFYWHVGFSKSEVETVVKLAYGSDNLYVLFENFEPKMNKVTALVEEDDDWNIFKDDSVGVLLNISGINEDYRFSANVNDFKIAQKNTRVYTEDSGFESSVKTYPDKWVVEMKIPFKDINYSAISGGTLSANFIRNRPQELNPSLHWSPTYNTADNIFRYGYLIFK